jgi:hypothetical protein
MRDDTNARNHQKLHVEDVFIYDKDSLGNDVVYNGTIIDSRCEAGTVSIRVPCGTSSTRNPPSWTTTHFLFQKSTYIIYNV